MELVWSNHVRLGSSWLAASFAIDTVIRRWKHFWDAYARRLDVIRANKSRGFNVYDSRASHPASLCCDHSWHWQTSSFSDVMAKEHYLTLFATSDGHSVFPFGLSVASDEFSCVAAWLSVECWRVSFIWACEQLWQEENPSKTPGGLQWRERLQRSL